MRPMTLTPSMLLVTLLVTSALPAASGFMQAADEWQWRTVDGALVATDGSPEFRPRTGIEIEAETYGIRVPGGRVAGTVASSSGTLKDAMPTEAITVEAWIAIDEPTRWGGFVSAVQDNAEAETGWVLGYDQSNPTFALSSKGSDDGDGVMTYLAGSKPYELGRWHHVVGTFDGSFMKVYLDGELVGESDAQSGDILYDGTERIALGGYLDRNEEHGLDGRILDLAVLPRAIDAAEVARRFQRHAELNALPPVVDTRLRWVVAPFLTWPTTTAMSVVGETSAPAVMKLEVLEESGEVRTTLESSGKTLHEFRVEGLEANRKYFYRMSGTSPDQPIDSGLLSFRTAAGRGDAFTFVAIGDTQSQPDVVKRVADLAYETRPSLLVHAGDLVTTGSDKSHWTHHFFPNMRPLISRVAMMPVLGNHEQDAKHYYDYMSLPTPERWYTFSYGDADFFMIDGNRSLADQSEQLQWLESALEASDAEWKFAVLHQPPWTSDSNDYGKTLETTSDQGDLNARNISSLLEKYGVDICFSGHVHDYERTFPIRDGEVVPWRDGGVIYVTCAGGGGYLEDFDPANTTFGHRKARRHHLVYCGIHGGILEFQAIDEDGRLFDVLTLDKRDARRRVDRANQTGGVEIAPRKPTWKNAPKD